MKNQNFEKRLEIVDGYLLRLKLSKDIRNYFKGRSILITGGAGAIGSNLVMTLSRLVGLEGKIIILDNLSSIKEKKPWNVPPLNNIIFVNGDVRNDIDLKRVFIENISIVYHLAAFFANQNSIDYPETSADVDIIGLIKILEYSRIAKVEKFIYGSSGCAIYGSFPELPISEDFISMHLTTPYQINKMTGEMYANYYLHHYEMNTVNCRFFNSYGPGEVPGQYRNVIPNFMYWALKKQSLPITGDGSETRDFTYVLDLVQGLVKSAFYDSAIGENFNLSAGKEISILGMAEKVNKTANNKSDIIFKKRRKWDTKPRLLASTKKANKLINYSPLVDFDEGFNLTVDWYKDNWESIEELSDFNPGLSSALNIK